MKRHFQLVFLVLATVLAHPVHSQSLPRADIKERMDNIIHEMDILCSNTSSAQKEQIESMTRLSNMLQLKWDGLYQSQIATISTDEELMTLAAEYEEAKKEATDSIESRKTILTQIANFSSTEKIILSNSKKFKEYANQATKLSLVKQTAPKLEKLKAQVQLEYASIERAYNEAEEAAQNNKKLSQRMSKMKDLFIEISQHKEAVQTSEYKPFVQRIKDYLISLAAVSIILLFISSLATRIQTLKKAKESAKKMQEMLNQQNNTTPTI